MNTKKKRRYKKPELKKLKISDGKFKFKEKHYSIEEILDEDSFSKYYSFQLKKTISHIFNLRNTPD
jgi:predicted RNA-binding protein associated with RNAse of E/G family